MAALLWFVVLLILSIGGYYGYQALMYWWADHQFLVARRRVNTAYIVTAGDNIIRVEVNPDAQMRGFYDALAKHRLNYRVRAGNPGLVWVGFPTNKYRLAAWSPTQYHEYVQGGQRHGVPLQVLRIEFPFQPDKTDLKQLNDAASTARSSFTKARLDPNVSVSYMTPDDADKLSYMPSFRSKDGIETNTHVTVFAMIVVPDDMIRWATHYQDEIKGLIVPAVRGIVADLELMNIQVAPIDENGQGTAAESKPSTITFERGKLLNEGQEKLRTALGVKPGERITEYRMYETLIQTPAAEAISIRNRILRDWGIFITDVVIRDAQEVSGAIETAAETYKQKQAEQAGELVAAQTARQKLILEGQGKARAIELVGSAQEKATRAQISGFSIGDKPTEDGRQAFLLWFANETYRQGMTTPGRTTYLQLPAQFAPFAAMFEELRNLSGTDLQEKLKQLGGGTTEKKDTDTKEGA